jgi:cytochrome c
MYKTLALAAALLLVAHGAARADERLVQDKQCLGCHDVARDGAGPSFQRIAVLWKGRKDAQEMLVATIRRGSSGTGGPHWNVATMPDQAQRPLVSEEEARRIAAWILAR